MLIRAYPSDTEVTVNGEPLGKTPVEYVVPRARWPRDGYFHYHAERADYRPQDGSFTSKPAGGRITGGIFTLGILFMFKRPTALPEELEIILEPVAATSPDAKGSSIQQSPEQQIRRLEKLLDEGLITEEEFKRQRKKILQSL